jgi:hypothetical protein
MRYCDQHPEEIDKLAKVKAQVTEVKGVMMQNIEKVYLILLLWVTEEIIIIFTFTNFIFDTKMALYWSSGPRSW